jgi:hypothetical protein
MTRALAHAFGIAGALALLIGLTPAVDAQVTTGTIVGSVKDSSGGVAAGATVTVTETGKGTSSSYHTDDTGSYIAPFLIPGTYEVAVELSGFKRHVRKGVVLQVNQRARVDVTLEVGGLTEATEVTAKWPQLRHAGLSRSRGDRGPGEREPFRGQHLQPPRRLQL